MKSERKGLGFMAYLTLGCAAIAAVLGVIDA